MSKTRKIIKKRHNNNQLNLNQSKNICKLSINLIKNNTNQINYKNYKNYITSIINNFTTSKNILPILNQIFIIKNNINFTSEYKKQYLDEFNKIPPFIDIFKYLMTKNEFINKFTKKELNELNEILHNKSNNKTNIYKFLDNSYLGEKISKNYYSIDTILKQELSAKFPSILFHNLLINSFTSYKIIEELDLNIKNLYTFSIDWKGKHIDNLLYLFTYDDKDDENIINNSYIKNIGNEIIERILFFNEYLQTDKLPNKFIVFLTDKKKEIDESVILNMHFKTINVNSAVTNGLDIIIYRKEELLKSIFHELIHFHNLDFRTIPNFLINYLKKTHNINPDNKYILFECITELLANLLNNIFLSRDIKEFKSNLENEILFSTLQVSKILKICKYNNWSEFTNLNDSNITTNTKKQFKQDSCVFSYYILKLYIMLNLEIYFKNCLDTKLKFIQTSQSFNKLIDIFNSSRKNLYFKNIINNILSSKSKTKTIKNQLNNTLRMTCTDKHIE